MLSIILASKSKIRKEILNKHNVLCDVEVSNVDEEYDEENEKNLDLSKTILTMTSFRDGNFLVIEMCLWKLT